MLPLQWPYVLKRLVEVDDKPCSKKQKVVEECCCICSEELTDGFIQPCSVCKVSIHVGCIERIYANSTDDFKCPVCRTMFDRTSISMSSIETMPRCILDHRIKKLLVTNTKVLSTALNADVSMFCKFDTKHRGNKILAMHAIGLCVSALDTYRVFKSTSRKLKSDEQLCKVVAAKDIGCVRIMGSEIRDNEVFMTSILTKENFFYVDEFASKRLKAKESYKNSISKFN